MSIVTRRSPVALAVLVGASIVSACSEPPQPIEVEVAQPGIADPAVDPETARAVGEALRQLQNGGSEPVPAADRAAARDASALHGRWTILHTIYRTNGEGGPPAPPIVPTTWELTPDGAFLVRGGNSIDAHYTYTGDRLVISGFGPVQDYRVDHLDAAELRLTSVIEAGSVRIENTTVLNRAP